MNTWVLFCGPTDPSATSKDCRGGNLRADIKGGSLEERVPAETGRLPAHWRHRGKHPASTAAAWLLKGQRLLGGHRARLLHEKLFLEIRDSDWAELLQLSPHRICSGSHDQHCQRHTHGWSVLLEPTSGLMVHQRARMQDGTQDVPGVAVLQAFPAPTARTQRSGPALSHSRRRETVGARLGLDSWGGGKGEEEPA